MRFVFKIVHKCSTCNKEHKLGDFRSSSKIFKTCVKCRDIGKKSRHKTKCVHRRKKSTCKDCNGASICIHNRRKSDCKACGGSRICQHNRRKDTCKVCGGTSICIHNRIKLRCKDCDGAGICDHNRQKSHCKICNNPIHITIRNMIHASKQKDKKINKYDETYFIDYPFIQHLISESNDKCYYCSCDLQYTHYTNNLATIERIDNSLGHIKSNCVIACRSCNLSKVGSREQIQ